MKILLVLLLVGLSLAQNSGPCSALSIPSSLPQTVRGSNVGASGNAPATGNCTATSQFISWYIYSSPTTIQVQVTTCSVDTQFDTDIYIFTGSSCSGLQCSYQNDDNSCIYNLGASTISGTFYAGTLYYIGVGGYGPNAGNFTLTISLANQVGGCGAATPLLAPYFPPTIVNGNNFHGATGYYVPSCDINNYAYTVWYEIYPLGGAPITLSTCNSGTSFDTVIAVVSGTCSSLSCVAYSDDNCNGFSSGYSTVTFVPTLPSYYVIVAGYSSNTGQYALSVSQPQPSTCANSLPIYPGNSTQQSTSNQPSLTDPCGQVTGNSGYWFSLQGLAASKPVTVSTCSPSTHFDTFITVYSGSCSSLNCVAYNDDATCSITGSQITSQVVFTPSTGTTYYAVVSGYGTASGSFIFTLSQ